MVKHVHITLDDKEHSRYEKLKGVMTWKILLEKGVSEEQHLKDETASIILSAQNKKVKKQ